MARSTARNRIFTGWRIAGRGALVAALLLPALAMQITQDVKWTAGDFVFAGCLLIFLGLTVEAALRMARSRSARNGYLLAGATAFATVWINAAVGIIGDDDVVNGFFFLAVLAGFFASAAVRFRPAALRWIMAVLVALQYAIGIAALFAMPVHGIEWGLLTGFAILWAAAAVCFHRAAHGRPGG